MMLLVLCVFVASASSLSSTELQGPEPAEIIAFPYCGRNGVYDNCVNQCPRQVCSDLWSKFRCEQIGECRPGCRCKPGYFRKDGTGHCISAFECMNPCGQNEYYVNESHVCQRTCSNWPYVSPFSRCKPHSGCVCKIGYARENPDATGACIPIAECPPPFLKCGLNEKPVRCKQICPPQSCDIAYTDYGCKLQQPCIAGCNCIDNYLRNSSNICILNDLCPPPCSVSSECKRTCANPNPKNCPDDPRPDVNEDGCRCAAEYVLSDINGKCIKIDECPKNLGCNGDKNAVINSCPSSCPLSCKYPKPRPCIQMCSEVKCVCKSGYILSENGTCIRPGQCKACPVSTECKRTCANPNPKNCPVNPRPDVNEDGCQCAADYFLSDVNGKCVKIDECPQDLGCNGDQNAVIKSCPTSCPLSCKNPQPRACNKRCSEFNCVCKPGYILSDNGKCILPGQCKGGDPCGKNATFVTCKNGCPTDYCPVDDSRAILICETAPFAPCQSGCACKLNHKRLSVKDNRCIVSSECPPVKCTRPHEVWDSCPSDCLSERCEDVNQQPTVCNTLLLNCQPKCVCEKGYFRNKDDICVRAEECHQCGKNETYVSCNVRCPTEFCPTSDDRFQIACSVAYPCPSGCACKFNYRRLSYENDTCILAQECPPLKCTRPNEEWSTCPSACLAEGCENVDNQPTTCNTLVETECQPRCTCKKGFFRNKNDICVPAEECRQCGANEIHVSCNVGCPTNYCPTSDDRGVIACDPAYPCPAGCACKLNYKRLSYGNDTCIPAKECPQLKCSRPNEEWSPCPSACLAERCEDVDNQPTTCNTLVENCQPQCTCKKGFFRNKDDICVPAEECRKCPANKNQTEVFCTFRCPHQYCPKDDDQAILLCKPPRNCPPGCGCLPNYKFKSYDDESCVLASDCPPVNCTRPHEVWNPCSSECLAENCDDIGKPSDGCVGGDCVPKCVCERGYFRNKEGICVPGKECANCGANSTFVFCKVGCPTNYCPVTDSRAIVACSPPYPCPSGCACKVNYRQKSISDPTCILASECPPVKCTRPHEVWNSCPSACLAEKCADVNKQPTTCNTLLLNCQPKCICEKGYFRNGTDICIPAAECSSSL